MRGGISSLDLDPSRLLDRVRSHPLLVGRDLASEASQADGYAHVSGRNGRRRLILVDGGAKESIARWIEQKSPTPVDVIRARCDATLDAVLAAEPCGVMVSNGPGDPAPVTTAIELVRGLLERRIPLAGICLGHQILALALGGTTYKMTFGHRGSNHPVREAATGRVMITSQNHGFAVDPTSLGIPWTPLDRAFAPQRPELIDTCAASAGRTMADRLPSDRLVGESPLGFGAIEATHLSLNDGTLEGLRLLERPAMSVQYHPEASPGPHDARRFFDRFWEMVEAHRA
jgi:carbamoyl-phosphate synthase small subunit